MIDTPEKLSPLVARAQESGVEMCLRLNLVCRRTRDEAVRAAETLQADQNTVQQVRNFLKKNDSQVFKDTFVGCRRHRLAKRVSMGWAGDQLWSFGDCYGGDSAGPCTGVS